MDSWLLFATLGVGVGAVYAALALGMVLTYRGSGVVNFAQVAMATYPAFVYIELRSKGDLVLPILPWYHRIDLADQLSFWPAFALALSVSAMMGFLIERLVFRPLSSATPVTKVIASVGVSTIILGLIAVQFSDRRGVVSFGRAGRILPGGTVHIFGVGVSYDRFVLAGIVVVLGLILWAVYRWSYFGLSTRAAAESRKGAELVGLSPGFLSSVNWVLASMVAGGVGIVAAPVTGVSLRGYGVYLAYALAAALAAQLRSFSVATIAGISLGMFEAVCVKLKGETWMPSLLKGGVDTAVPFLVIVGVLFVVGSTLPTRGTVLDQRHPASPTPRFNPFILVPALGVAFGVLAFAGSALRLAMTESLIVSVLSLSLVLMAGFVGQVTLAELTFAGIAAFALARLADVYGIGFPWSPLLAIAITTVISAFLSFPAVRIRGLQLAIVTYSGAIAIEQILFHNPKLTGVGGFVTSPAPEIFGAPFGPGSGPKRTPGAFPYKAFGFFVLAVAVLCGLLVANVRRGAVGRRMLAVRANERAAAACGVHVPRTKLLGATVGCFVASCAGVLWAYKYIQFNSETFPASDALDFIALAYIGGIAMVSGAYIAGTFASAGIFFAIWSGGSGPPRWQLLASGIGMVIVAVRFPGGLASAAPAVRRWWAARRAAS